MKAQFCGVAVLGLIFGACNKTTEGPATADAVQPGTPAPAAGTQEPAYVSNIEALRREPVTDAKVADKTGKKKEVFNYMTTLQRGETVTVLETKDTWTRVRAADESEGWVRTDRLVPAGTAKIATVVDETSTYDRPQLVSLSSKKIKAGTLVFALRNKEQFSEVDYGAGKAWIKTDSLQTDANEVEVAKILAKADWLDKRAADEKDKEKKASTIKDANELRSMVRSQFASSRLVGLVDKPAEGAPTEPQDAAAAAQPAAAPAQP